VEIWHGQEFRLAVGQPLLGSGGLALWAMPIATGVVRDAPVGAGFARVRFDFSISGWDGGRARTATVLSVGSTANGRVMGRREIFVLAAQGGAEACHRLGVGVTGEISVRPPNAAVRQRSVADMTLSWPRLTWPAWDARQAGPRWRKMSATSTAGRDNGRASAGHLAQKVQRARHLADRADGDAGVKRRRVELASPPARCSESGGGRSAAHRGDEHQAQGDSELGLCHRPASLGGRIAQEPTDSTNSPAVSSFEAFRTPASESLIAPLPGRRPKTLSESGPSGRGLRRERRDFSRRL
jgi:hypothetical protein